MFWKPADAVSVVHASVRSWCDRVCVQEKASLAARVEEMMQHSVALFQKRDDRDELEGFQQQELAKLKHMVRTHGLGFAALVTNWFSSIH